MQHIVFFCGFAGENAGYGFGVHEANGTGYCSQEKQVEPPNSEIFEIFWEPQHVGFTTGTDENARRAMMAQNSGGFSGSLVWNTRYLECVSAGREWKPEQAVVTGLLRRWEAVSQNFHFC